MLTDDEKARLTERVAFEQELKKALEPARDSSWRSVLESKLGLVVVGFMLTGVLVPGLQYFQETIKWQRQNRYENVKYRLGLMRQCMAEFVLLSAFTSEAYLKAEPLLAQATSLDPKAQAVYVSQRIDLQNRRFQQNAKVSALFVHFEAKDALDKDFNAYLKVVSEYMAALEAAVQRPRGNPASEEASQEKLRELDVLTVALNEAYALVLGGIRKELSEVENESQSFM
jgi:hypothetical protein